MDDVIARWERETPNDPLIIAGLEIASRVERPDQILLLKDESPQTVGRILVAAAMWAQDHPDDPHGWWTAVSPGLASMRGDLDTRAAKAFSGIQARHRAQKAAEIKAARNS